MSDRIPQRDNVAAENKWSINDIYSSDEAWENDYTKAQTFVYKISSYNGKLCKSSQKLLEYLKLDDELTLIFDSLANYAQRKSDEDTRVAKYQDMCNRLESLYVQIAGAASFVTPEILSISDDDMEQFFIESPDLELYRRSINSIRRRRSHYLSENEERIIALTGEMLSTPENVFSMFNDADLKFPDAVGKDGKTHQITHESYIPLVQSEDRVLRKSAFENLYHTYESFKNTSAAMLSAQVKTLVFNARARKYNSTLEAALDVNEVDTAVYRNLIDAVHENMDAMHRYVKLRKKALGVDELHAYDLYTPIVEGIEDNVPYEQAKKEVYESLAPMGEEYRAIFKQGLEQGWVDLLENEGK